MQVRGVSVLVIRGLALYRPALLHGQHSARPHSLFCMLFCAIVTALAVS